MRLSKVGKERAREAAARRATSATPLKRRSCVRYDPVLAAKICRLISIGKSVKCICERASMPRSGTIFAWARDNEAFREEYRLARQFARDRLEDEILEIIDDTSKDIVLLKLNNGQAREVLNPVAVQRDKARVSARQQLIARHSTTNKHDPIEGPAKTAAPANVLTEERRQKLMERRRAAIEANLRAAGKQGAT